MDKIYVLFRTYECSGTHLEYIGTYSSEEAARAAPEVEGLSCFMNDYPDEAGVAVIVTDRVRRA